jgi:ABC-type Fe3+-siderophore transport system permease subunit
MNSLPEVHSPPMELGMSSLVLGTIGLMLFFLPVLGIPISAFGLLFGLLGLVAALFWSKGGGGARLRWTLAGIAVSFLGLAVNIAIAYAPAGYLPGRDVPQLWQSPPDRPYVPPPAR